MDKWLKKTSGLKQTIEIENEKEDSVPTKPDNKRKIDENPSTSSESSKRVKRKYDSEYLKFGFTWNSKEDDPRPLCVICQEILANESMRPNKLLRHFETKHSDFKNKPMDYFQNKLQDLNNSKNKLCRFISVNEKAMLASYLISLRIAQSGKPHTIGESLVLPAIKDAVEVMFGERSLKEVESIPLSNNTVARRIDEMAEWVENQLIHRIQIGGLFALQLDESTDVQGLSQLLIFIRFIWNKEIFEDILFCEPIIRGTGEIIFDTLDNYITLKKLDWKNCVGICTDGARAMCGKYSGVVTRCLQKCPNAKWTHCTIHREALVSKKIPKRLNTVLTTAIKIVNFIKSNPLQSRLFQKLCEAMGSLHQSLLLHTEVRWLSRGKVLTRLVELREEVAIYLNENKQDEYTTALRDVNYILLLTYLADIFSKLNELNLQLQETNGIDIFSVHGKIKAFIKKLMLWKNNVQDCKYDCFDAFQTFVIENEITPDNDIIVLIIEHLDTLKENFDFYFFEEFKNLEKYTWVRNPFQSGLVTGISTRADEELIELSEDSAVKFNFDPRKLLQFWLSMQNTHLTLHTEALKVLLPFTTSYLCEVGFSTMIAIKSKYRNKLQLLNSLRLKITNIKVDVEDVIAKNRKQAHSSHGSY